jgi:hypothetical protein
MRKTVGGIASILGIALLAGCVQTPRLDVVTTGVLPLAPSSFSLVDGPDTAARAALSDCLTGHGIGRSAKPTYLAQVSEADRPKSVGASERQPGAKKGKPQWLPGAAPDRHAVRSLTLSLIQASTGVEVYRLVVSERYSPRPNHSKPNDLTKMACDNLSSPT